MKLNLFVILTILMHVNAYSQSSVGQISAFENGLTTTTQLKDSAIVHYNILNRMKSLNVPAVSVAVIKNGKIALAKAYGEADMAMHTKADTATLFHAASISKTINALCILRLVEEGKLSLTTDFRTYIKDGSFKENKFSKGEKITIADLLSHTAGITRDDGPSGDYSSKMKLPSITEIVKGVKPALGKGAYSIRKPNETYEYSNQAICITQKILSDNFDENYNRLITNKVFAPLVMTNSNFDILRPAAVEEKLAKGYLADNREVAPWIFPCPSQGGLVTTASDIAKVVIAIQNAYNEKDTGFLKKETIQKMFMPRLDSQTHMGELDMPYKNGLGVMFFNKGGNAYFTHAGYVEGYVSVYLGSYDGKNGAVVLVNSLNAAIITEILNSIATTFNWENYVQYAYKTNIQLGDSLLNRYVGSYKQITKQGEYVRTITKLGNQLYIKANNDGEAQKLYFSTDKTAFVLSRKYIIRFLPNETGKNVGKIIIDNSGNLSGEATRVN